MGDGFAQVPIRYDGADAEQHTIELSLLGESLYGVARILAAAGHFAATGQYAKQLQAMDVKVYVSEGKENCYSLTAFLAAAKDHQLFSGLAGIILGPILGWIFARVSNNREEMKLLKASLDHAISELAGQNKDLIPKYLTTLERIAESLRPAARDAVAPIGKSCKSMQVGGGPIIDEAAAQAIRSTSPDELTDEKSWDIVITEMDREDWRAKVRLADEEFADERRVRAVITDPAMGMTGNPYMRAFVNNEVLRVRAKATLKDGDVQVLYISNTEFLE